MAAVIAFGKDRMNVDSGITIEKAISSLGKYPDTFLYIFRGSPVPMTIVIEDGAEIEAIRIASGG